MKVLQIDFSQDYSRHFDLNSKFFIQMLNYVKRKKQPVLKDLIQIELLWDDLVFSVN